MITGYACIIWAEILDGKMVTGLQLKKDKLNKIQKATRKTNLLCLDIRELTNHSS